MKKRKTTFWIIILITLAAAVTIFLNYRNKSNAVEYKTASVERGPVMQTVTATGTLNAVVSVQVGSQVSGIISELMVDFNSSVKEGQVIAQIDPASFEAKVEQSKANLSNALAAVSNAKANIESVKADIENARAKVQSSKADMEKFRVGVEDAKRTLTQNEELYAEKLISQTERDKARINYESSIAQWKSSQAQLDSSVAQLNSSQAKLKVAEAQYQAALAQVEQARASLKVTELDLGHTTIISPVDGIVVLRNVDVGQTVAASLQAPTLFLIAKDLTKMQVNASVSEADIGKIKEGQEATFLVDAFPITPFKGTVVQVRNAPVTVQNVVTYDVIIAVDNPRLELKPGMTANVSVIVAKKDNVLKVANAALRFQPKDADKELTAPGHNTRSTADSGTALASNEGATAGRSFADRLVKQLTLSKEQEEKVRAIVQETEQRRMKLGKEASKQEIMAVRKESKEKIWAILEGDQKTKFESILKAMAKEGNNRSSSGYEGRKGRLWVLSSGVKPVMVPVTLGIWDEGFTEILSGQVKEGDSIIVGENIKGNSSAAAPPRLRMW